MIRLQPYNRTQLRALIDAPAFSELPFLPISYHRAISHIHNPRADQDDTLLIIAYDDQKMVGYLGILPDWIFDQSGNKSKCGWLSCMWIDPNCRGKGISKKLVAHALESWNQKILVTEFTGPAKGLYDKSGAFKDLQINEGIRLYIRADLSKLLPPKSQYFKKLKPFWQVIDLLFNKVFDIRFSFIHLPKPNWQYVSDIDQELNNFISGQQENQIFIRQREELNWILNYPWIISSNEDAMSQKYYFSSVAKTFEQKAIKLENESKEIVGFMILTRRDSSLKIPYFYCKKEYLPMALDCIRWHLYQWKIKTATIFNKSLVKAFQVNSRPALYTRSIKRHYIISKIFDNFSISEEYEIQDGDADAAFT